MVLLERRVFPALSHWHYLSGTIQVIRARPYLFHEFLALNYFIKIALLVGGLVQFPVDDFLVNAFLNCET